MQRLVLPNLQRDEVNAEIVEIVLSVEIVPSVATVLSALQDQKCRFLKEED